MTEEQEYVYKGVTIGHYTIAFDKVEHVETVPAATEQEEPRLIVSFSGGQIYLRGQDAENFYNAYRAYLGYFYEVDEDEELPF